MRGLGCEIVARNARTALGEIDLIVCDGQALVFVEVKARRLGGRLGPERPAAAVDDAKRRRLRRAARAWLAEGQPTPPHRELRFDVVGVSFDADGQVTDLEHLRGAF